MCLDIGFSTYMSGKKEIVYLSNVMSSISSWYVVKVQHTVLEQKFLNIRNVNSIRLPPFLADLDLASILFGAILEFQQA